jgi:hypothetical protein
MIRMMKVLVGKYKHQQRIYLSWDAASWQVSKLLTEKIEEHNTSGTWPVVATAPLPTRAQFSTLSNRSLAGRRVSVIQNSNYPSVDDAKAAIDRYFEERNAYFKEHPRKAGNKI